MIALSNVRHSRSRFPDHARGVAAPDVEVVRLTQARVNLCHVERDSTGRPHVVVVDAGGHHEHERLAGPSTGRLDHLSLEGLIRLPEALRPDDLRVHPGGNGPLGWDPSHLVQVLRHP